MLRYIGICLMAGAAMAGGFWAARMLMEQLEILYVFRQMIYHLNARILHVNEALPEALMEVGSRFTEQQKGKLKEPGILFVQIAGRLERERSAIFSNIWKEEVQKMPVRTTMQKKDLRNLLELGDNLGYADRKMQEQTLLFYLERTDDSIEALKAELDERTKLYRSLGVAAGLFLVVFLI